MPITMRAGARKEDTVPWVRQSRADKEQSRDKGKQGQALLVELHTNHFDFTVWVSAQSGDVPRLVLALGALLNQSL